MIANLRPATRPNQGLVEIDILPNVKSSDLKSSAAGRSRGGGGVEEQAWKNALDEEKKRKK